MAAASASPAFVLDGVVPSPLSWGPVASDPRFDEVPYSHFSRTERVTKVAEVSATAKASCETSRRALRLSWLLAPGCRGVPAV